MGASTQEDQFEEKHKFGPGNNPQLIGFRSILMVRMSLKLEREAGELLAETMMKSWFSLLVRLGS
jgi:hypothetical protein